LRFLKDLLIYVRKSNHKKMKMFSLSCKDVGIQKCDHASLSENREEVMQMMDEHIQKVHPKDPLAKMSKEERDPKLMEKIVESDEEEEDDIDEYIM